MFLSTICCLFLENNTTIQYNTSAEVFGVGCQKEELSLWAGTVKNTLEIFLDTTLIRIAF